MGDLLNIGLKTSNSTDLAISLYLDFIFYSLSFSYFYPKCTNSCLKLLRRGKFCVKGLLTTLNHPFLIISFVGQKEKGSSLMRSLGIPLTMVGRLEFTSDCTIDILFYFSVIFLLVPYSYTPLSYQGLTLDTHHTSLPSNEETALSSFESKTVDSYWYVKKTNLLLGLGDCLLILKMLWV